MQSSARLGGQWLLQLCRRKRERLRVDGRAKIWDSAGYVARIQLLLAVVESNEQDVLRGPRDCGEEGDSQLEQSYGGRARGKAPAQERPGTSSC